jgi:hypothetical protein
MLPGLVALFLAYFGKRQMESLTYAKYGSEFLRMDGGVCFMFRHGS